MLQAAQEAGARIVQIFVGDEVTSDVAAMANGARAADGPVVTRVDPRTLESLAQTKSPQGIVAVVGFVDRELRELGQLVAGLGNALVLVLPTLGDPGNAGTLIRSAEAFGVSAICFGPHAVEPYNDKVVRASMGSLFRVPLVRYHEWTELATALRDADMRIVAADASGEDVRRVTLPQRAALVVGQERHGLAGIPRADIDTVVAVPQRRDVESLNAGVAGSLLLYECARAQGLFSGPERQDNAKM
jgi:TrmH family RNA methyltransferase